MDPDPVLPPPPMVAPTTPSVTALFSWPATTFAPPVSPSGAVPCVPSRNAGVPFVVNTSGFPVPLLTARVNSAVSGSAAVPTCSCESGGSAVGVSVSVPTCSRVAVVGVSVSSSVPTCLAGSPPGDPPPKPKNATRAVASRPRDASIPRRDSGSARSVVSGGVGSVSAASLVDSGSVSGVSSGVSSCVI